MAGEGTSSNITSNLKRSEIVKAQIVRYLLAVVLHVLTLGLFAYSGGSGTESSPYQIATLADLQQLSLTPDDWVQGKYFIQTANIDASETVNWNNGQGFCPIGDYLNSNQSRQFSGRYNGDEHTISNLFINRPESRYQGLFGSTDSYIAIIQNVGLVDVDITGSYEVGGLVGQNRVTISNCYSSGNVAGIYEVGGLIGLNLSDVTDSYSAGSVTGTGSVGGLLGRSNFSTITNCNSSSTITGSETFIGGLVGDTGYSSTINGSYCTGNVTGTNEVGGFVGGNYNSSISECYSTGDVTGTGAVGGFVGRNYEATVSDCYSIGSVDAFRGVGGLVGENSYSTICYCKSTGSVTGSQYYIGGLVGINHISSITNCSSTGSVMGNGDNVGGLLGSNGSDSTVSNCFSTGSVTGLHYYVGGLIGQCEYGSVITNCYSIGNVDCVLYHVGGLIGYSYLATINNCYWNIETSNQATSSGGEGRTTDEMTYPFSANTYTGWDFIDIWQAEVSNNGYPILRNMPTVDTQDEFIGVSLLFHMKNFPNPFNPNTSIVYSLPKSAPTTLSIYNIRGQLVRKLVNEPLSSGEHTVTWDGRDDSGKSLASGMYLCRISSAGKQETRKMLLMK